MILEFRIAFPLESAACFTVRCAGRHVRSQDEVFSAIQGANCRYHSVQLMTQGIMKWNHCRSQEWGKWLPYLLLRRELSSIKLSSMLVMTSEVLSPLRRSSPRVLKLLNVNVLLSHSEITCFSFCSMSLSFTALMQMSYWHSKLSFISGKLHVLLIVWVRKSSSYLFHMYLKHMCFQISNAMP